MKKRKKKYGSYFIKHLGICFALACIAAIALLEYDYGRYFLGAKRNIQEDFNDTVETAKYLLADQRYEDVEGTLLALLNQLRCGGTYGRGVSDATLGSGGSEYVYATGWDGKPQGFGGNFIPWNVIMDDETKEILTQNKDMDSVTLAYLITKDRNERNTRGALGIRYYFCDREKLGNYVGDLQHKKEEWIKKLEKEDVGCHKVFAWNIDSFYHKGSEFLPARITLNYSAYEEPNKLISKLVSERVLETIELKPENAGEYELYVVDPEKEYGLSMNYVDGLIREGEDVQYKNIDDEFTGRAMKRYGELERLYLREQYEGAWKEKKGILGFFPGNMTFAMERKLTDVTGRSFSFYSYQEIKNTYRMNMTDHVLQWIALLFFTFLAALLFSYLEYVRKRYRGMTQEYREMLTDSMAHDLKTPLMAIGGYAENLRAHVNDDKREHYAEEIQNGVAYMNEIIMKNLELLRFDREHRRIRKTKLDVRKLFEEAFERENGEIMRKELKVTIEGNMTAKGDAALLEKVADNLVSNCVKYTKDGGRISVTFRKRKFVIQNETELSYDREKDLRNLWEPFVRGQDSRTGTGTGLGLAIVANVLDRHRWRYVLRYDKETKIFVCEVSDPFMTIT